MNGPVKMLAMQVKNRTSRGKKCLSPVRYIYLPLNVLAEHKIKLIHKTEVFIQALAELLNKQHLGEVI